MNYIDIHSHVLPCMDDGAGDMETALEMLRIAQAEGISDIIVTPHYTSGRFRADSRRLQEQLDMLREKVLEEGLSVNLYSGTEVYYRGGLEEKFESGEFCTMNGTEYVLVEFSPTEDYLGIRTAVDDLFCMGMHPILAHVERYQCLCKSPQYLRELKNMGCEFQVNAGSVTGESGFVIKRRVHRLLKEELIDYIGTDAHDVGMRKPAIKKSARILYKKYDKSYADAVLFQNAAKRLRIKDKRSK